jgi:hypothetical protein
VIKFIQVDIDTFIVEIALGLFNFIGNSESYSCGCVKITVVNRGVICISRELDDDYGVVIINGNISLEKRSPIITSVNLPYLFTIQQEILDV